MIADLHCHYPMHLLEQGPREATLKALLRLSGRPLLQKLRAAILSVAARLLNFRRFSDHWRVDLERLERGDVRVVYSVLYLPYDEMDSEHWPAGMPADHYYRELVRHLDRVEHELERADPGGERHRIVRNTADLDAVRGGKPVGIVHCVEGGFHLGGTVAEIDERVAELARRGVAYVTLAHLFWRQVATNAPAIPFLSDGLYNLLFPQPRDEGLTELGRAAVAAMHRHRVMVDISHMREDAIAETFDLLDDLDAAAGTSPDELPVIATHAGFRFGRQTYMLSADTIARIARRDGVVGLIMARHQLEDGVDVDGDDDLERTVATMRRHIDEIHRQTGSHRHVGIGSDLDGFIKPTMAGIEYADDLAKLADPLGAAYPDDAEAILHGNAARVLARTLAGRQAQR